MKQKGFTLLEALIYTALLALVGTAAILAVFSSFKTVGQIKIDRLLAAAGESALERLSREVRGASSINAAQSIFDVHPGALSLNTTNDNGDPATISFTVAGGELVVVDTDGSSYPLLSANASSTLLIFRQISASSSAGVKIEMSLIDERAPTRVVNFNNSVVMRGSY